MVVVVDFVPLIFACIGWPPWQQLGDSRPFRPQFLVDFQQVLIFLITIAGISGTVQIAQSDSIIFNALSPLHSTALWIHSDPDDL
eukprot:SAG31_NODE_7227_length_1749_cov_1.548485_2_plen_85_part_00